MRAACGPGKDAVVVVLLLLALPVGRVVGVTQHAQALPVDGLLGVSGLDREVGPAAPLAGEGQRLLIDPAVLCMAVEEVGDDDFVLAAHRQAQMRGG